jgi:hypothetical protein
MEKRFSKISYYLFIKLAMSNQYSCFSQKNYDRIWDKSHAD